MLESLKTIVKTNSDKKLFDGDLQVSYGEFYNLVRQDMASQDNRKHVISTHSLLNQLVRFVSKLCQKALPIICKPNLTHNEISRLEKEVQYAPQLADFGVLSSGTTADAKLLWRSFALWSDFFSIQNAYFSVTSNSRLFIQGDFSFTGNLNLALSLLLLGGTLVVTQKNSVKYWQTLWEKTGVTHLYLLPSYLKLVEQYSKETALDNKTIITSSQYVSDSLLEGLYIKHPKVSVKIFYGASELNYVSWYDGRDIRDKPQYVGEIVPNVAVRIKEGRIFVKTPYSICGLSSEYCAGDYGELIDGKLYLFGRGDDWCNQSGIKLYLPRLIEKIKTCPYIKDAVAFTKESQSHGQESHCCIVLIENQMQQECLKWLSEHFEKKYGFKHYHIVSKIPLMPSGKIDYQQLKRQLA